MNIALLGGSAVLPALLLLWYIYTRDAHPEPRSVVLRTFLWGMVICLPAGLAALALESVAHSAMLAAQVAETNWTSAFIQGFVGAGLPEELCKLWVVWRVMKDPAFDEPMDGLVYGMTASLGFATLENVLYVGDGGAGVALLRALTAVPGHASTGAIMGAYLARAKFGLASQRRTNVALALLVPMALHGAYDTFLFSASGWVLMGLVVLLVELGWTRSLVRSFSAEQRQLELVAQGRRPVSDVQPAEGPERKPAGAWAWFKLVSGFVVASVGSLLLLLFAGTYFIEVHDTETTLGFAVIAVIVGLPTLVSIALFRSGLRAVRAAPVGLTP